MPQRPCHARRRPTSTWAQTSEEDEYAAENLRQFFVDLGINAAEFFVLGAIYDAKDAYDAAVEGEYGTAIIYVAFTLCDVAKPCKVVKAPLRGLFRTTKATRTVIGRTKDLRHLPSDEKSLLDRLTPDLGSPKPNWKRNSGVVRQEMRRGLPIRDASPGDTSGVFLNAERALLRDRGWTFDSKTGYWMPPGSPP